MKSFLLLLTTLPILFISSGIAVAYPQENGEVPLKETPPPLGDRPRDEGNPVVTCYVVQDNLVLHAGGSIVSANVTIENLTTGSDANYNTIFGILPVYFPLFGTGDYVITIMLTSGAIYQGVFHY